MATEPKIRMGFTKEELVLIYAGLGSVAGSIRDRAAIDHQAVSTEVRNIQKLQDRIYEAVEDEKESE